MEKMDIRLMEENAYDLLLILWSKAEDCDHRECILRDIHKRPFQESRSNDLKSNFLSCIKGTY